MSTIKVILAVITLAVSIMSMANNELKKISIRDVLNHNTKESCWMVYEKHVYDLSKYIDKHPAPPVILLKYCGKDGTNAFKTKGIKKNHSKDAYKLLESMKIGVLDI